MAESRKHIGAEITANPAQDSPNREEIRLTRRNILAASAGLGAAAGLSLAGSARAETKRNDSDHTGHGSPSKSMSQRAYPIPGKATASVARNPVDLPGPIGRREPTTIRVDFETSEVEAALGSGSSFRFWTFGGKVPGPFVRVRVGDTVEVKLRNRADSQMVHNVDFHAVTGPHGGAGATTAQPGEEGSFRFKALKAGIHVYHCAVPPVAMHIAKGMYGLILVEPAEGLPKVDREFYVMQGEIYSEQEFGSSGLLEDSHQKLLDERPEYFLFNGSVGALTEQHPMKAKVGETIRIFFGVGGPNHTSSFHLIGEILDRVYTWGDLVSPPARDVGTVSVPPGGAVMVEVKLEVPGRYVLVDHALSRVERGLAGWLDVEGPGNPDIFHAVHKE